VEGSPRSVPAVITAALERRGVAKSYLLEERSAVVVEVCRTGLGGEPARELVRRSDGGVSRRVPPAWREALFERRGGALAVREPYRSAVALRAQDLQREAPDGPFDLVLCRNVAFTYFAAPVQREVLARIAAHSHPGAALVLGRHERLPDGAPEFRPWPGMPSTFRFEAGPLRGRGRPREVEVDQASGSGSPEVDRGVDRVTSGRNDAAARARGDEASPRGSIFPPDLTNPPWRT